MRCALTITILHLAIVTCSAVNGVIWYKEKQEFVQLFSIPQFAAFRNETLAKQRELESRDMKDVVIKAVFYEEKNIVMFTDNDTKITGICGDVWYLLADYLNFTLKPVKSNLRIFGRRLKNGTTTGLLSVLEDNKAEVILRGGIFSSRINEVDFTMPVWKSKNHIYVQPEWHYDNKWVFTLFSAKTWYCITFLFIIISCFGYFLQKVPKPRKRRRKDSIDFNLNDHFFYSFAMMCSQGYIPDAFHNKFKILAFSKSIFAWLIVLAFNANLIYRMSNRETTLSFTNIDNLITNTKYVLLALPGSMFHNLIKDSYGNNTDILNRIQLVATAEDMHIKICDNSEKYAMLELEDRYMALSRYSCPLLPVGNYNETWIAFALKKNFPYKKTINTALMRFNEIGLMDSLRDHWLNFRSELPKETKKFKMIDLEQVYMIFLIFNCGTAISLIILILENIIHYRETHRECTSHRHK